LKNLSQNSASPDSQSAPQIDASLEKEKLALVLRQIYHSGPIPHPIILRQYEELLPGAADRIIKMAEKQAEHRQELEKKNLDYSHGQITKGQYLGFFIGLISIIAGAYCSIQGATIPGSFIGTAGVVGLVTVFVLGSRKKGKDSN